MLKLTSVIVSMEMLEKAMGLPHGMKLTHINQFNSQSDRPDRHLKLHFAVDVELPLLRQEDEDPSVYYQTMSLADIGDMYLNPDKYAVPAKGLVRGGPDAS